MLRNVFPFYFTTAFCAILTACASPSTQRSLYELPSTPQPYSAHPVLMDNDSYYVQPSGFKGCSTINDAPSCGGG